jgi:hypothetical protein
MINSTYLVHNHVWSLSFQRMLSTFLSTDNSIAQQNPPRAKTQSSWMDHSQWFVTNILKFNWLLISNQKKNGMSLDVYLFSPVFQSDVKFCTKRWCPSCSIFQWIQSVSYGKCCCSDDVSEIVPGDSWRLQMKNYRSPQVSPSFFFILEGIYGWTHSRSKNHW